MRFIVAVAKDWAIGKDGKMLFHLPQDLAFFKQTTLGSALLMGRKTFESLPNGALPERINFVLTRNKSFQADGVEVIHELSEIDEALDKLGNPPLFLIGGGELYHRLLDSCDEGYVTRIDEKAEADTFFPNLDQHPAWEWVETIATGIDQGYSYAIERYRRQKGGDGIG